MRTLAPTAVCLVAALAAVPAARQPHAAPFQVGVRVLDRETRQPLLEATVMVTSDGGGDRNRRSFIPDEEGSVLVRDARYGPVWMVAHAPGYGRAYGYFFADRDHIQEVELLLPVGARVYGIILGPGGQPVSHATVKVRYRDTIMSRLMQSPARAAIERATAEGFDVSLGMSSWHRGCLYTSCGSMDMAPGEFSVLDIDPNRPFLLSVTHDSLGRLESEVFELGPGERLDGVTLIYQ